MGGAVPGMGKVQKEMERVEEEKNKLLEKNDEKSEAERRILVARVAGLEVQIWMVWSEGDNLRKELEKEKIEKGELVAQVILFLTMSV
jgi:p-aminobenzoyl-glutamate transporter AbgT